MRASINPKSGALWAFRNPKSIIVRAPVRISFGGGGTDLAAYYAVHGGFVVSAAISRYCYVTVRGTTDAGIRINSADYHVCETFSPGAGAARSTGAEGDLLRLPRAVVESFGDHGLGERGADLFIATEVAPGTGLGSSSAVAVALVRALSTHLGMSPSPAEVAEAASMIEIERLGMPIGRQDQYASAFGGLNTIEFAADGVAVRPLEIAPELARELDTRLMLFATGLSRNSATILHQQQQDSHANPAVVERLHRLKALAHEMCRALLDERLDDFGHLLDRAWREKRGLSSNISTGAIDRWYDAALTAGALGGKITGAGGGGYLLLYVAPERRPAVRQVMRDFGLQEMPFDFDYDGARVAGTEDMKAHG